MTCHPATILAGGLHDPDHLREILESEPAPCTALYHERLRHDDAAWSRCECIGIQVVPDGDDIELRQCPRCRTTMARPVRP